MICTQSYVLEILVSLLFVPIFVVDVVVDVAPTSGLITFEFVYYLNIDSKTNQYINIFNFYYCCINI